MSTRLPATDVLIVGAGPAGATLSLFLSQAKIPHTIIDKATFPRDKADGNIYGAKVMEVLDCLDADYLPELAALSERFSAGNVVQVATPNGSRINFRVPHPEMDSAASRSAAVQDVPFFTMNRRDFDNFLVEKLESDYAQQLFGTSLKSLAKGATPNARWQVTIEKEGQTTELMPQLVIAADGANSKVLQTLGLQLPAARYHDTVQAYFRGVKGFDDATIVSLGDEQPRSFVHTEAHFLPESTPGFFFVVPIADGTFSVGVGKPRTDKEQQNTNLCELLHDITHNHPEFAARFAEAEMVSELRPWPLTAGIVGKASISGDGYLVTGDAAGLCTPLTYFGTGNAMVSAMLAAEQVQRSLSQQRFSADVLAEYDRALYGRLQKEFQAATLMRSLIKQKWLFNLISRNAPVRSVLRRSFKKASVMLKRL